MHRLNPYLEKKPDFARLASRFPDFAPFVTVSEEGYASIDFQNAAALRALTRCLLKEDWNLDVDLREDRLCPTLPNRLDYLLHVLDMEPHLPSTSSSTPLRVLDIGTGASAIYPILLHRLRPEAHITATELDQVSYDHARCVLTSNTIPSSSVAIRKSPVAEPIFFPLLELAHGQDSKERGETHQWDLTICNPPFFGSEEEMQEGQDLKEQVAHAAPTAAHNELITPGGEVAFVSMMIEESIQLGDRCRWYTSLIGKYTSLHPLVELLRKHKIDNYMLRNIRQAKTTRWILGWSHHPSRLPDNLARPDDVIPNTSFAKLLPPSNTLNHRPQPAVPLDDLRRTVLAVLAGISLLSEPADRSAPVSPHPAERDEGGGVEDDIMLAPTKNTWSRAARRQAARRTDSDHAVEPSEGGGTSILHSSATEPHTDSSAAARIPPVPNNNTPLFRAKVRFVPPKREDEVGEGASIAIDWLEGRDRAVVEALWKFLLTKGGLISSRADVVGDGGYGGRLGAGFDNFKGRGRNEIARGVKGGRTKGGKRQRGYDHDQGDEEELPGARTGQKRRLG
ncbi:hypothetical protein I317_07667 [Kwoniella heveanensis CBS 569]|nr:hypothetical protein I317_07667 [Kwoniella heveanensis CBS 569]